MELHSVPNTFHHSRLGQEKHEMLSLNRRLEAYLNRVKLLEEENALLATEIRSLKHSEHGALAHRMGLEDELTQARLQVDAAWRDRVQTELEVGRLAEELRALNLQRQREAEGHMKAKTMLERSRRELEEEQRAQIWLREEVTQLQHEMRLLILNHQEDVARVEATLARPRAEALPTPGTQHPTLLQLGQEFCQRATGARQEAAEACQAQLARLGESLHQARSRLSQVTREKSQILLKLQTLQEQMTSAQDARLRLEKTAAQQRARHSQEVQELQEHLEGLEHEKEELAEHISRILLENRGLLQLKMSLGLEVATYRALLDMESFTGDVSFSNSDAGFCPRGMRKNLWTSSLPAGMGLTVITATPAKPSKPVTGQSSYPKILQDRAVEYFRPRDVCEKVTQAEPLSAPDEEEALTTSGDKRGAEVCTGQAEGRPRAESPVNPRAESPVNPRAESPVGPAESPVGPRAESPVGPAESPVGPAESPVGPRAESPVGPAESPVGPRAESPVGPRAESPVGRPAEAGYSCELLFTDDSRHVSPASARTPDVSFQGQTRVPADRVGVAGVEQVETEAVRELPVWEPEERAFTTETRSQAGGHETQAEEKLYPDGEEMDTWDSVMERKVEVQTDDRVTNGEEPRQHAEPEEDMSAKEAEQAADTRDEGVQQEDDDSQDVSVSWRTEVESDSYAQENTLADTRPLIHYTSDTHVDQSDQEKKVGEAGAWSKTFGTMEDLCEEAEAEYDLEETVEGANEEDGDEELDPDRLLQQELESCSDGVPGEGELQDGDAPEDDEDASIASEPQMEEMSDAPCGGGQEHLDQFPAAAEQTASNAEHGQTCEEGCHHGNRGSDQSVVTLSEASPDSRPDESETFVNEPKGFLDQTGRNRDPHEVLRFSAPRQPHDAFNEVAENLGFGEKLVWADLENTNVLNGNSRVESESATVVNAEGGLLHSEESEAEGESWSSGEEPI